MTKVEGVDMTFTIWLAREDFDLLLDSGVYFAVAGKINDGKLLVFVRDKQSAEFALGHRYETPPQ